VKISFEIQKKDSNISYSLLEWFINLCKENSEYNNLRLETDNDFRMFMEIWTYASVLEDPPRWFPDETCYTEFLIKKIESNDLLRRIANHPLLATLLFTYRYTVFESKEIPSSIIDQVSYLSSTNKDNENLIYQTLTWFLDHIYIYLN